MVEFYFPNPKIDNPFYIFKFSFAVALLVNNYYTLLYLSAFIFDHSFFISANLLAIAAGSAFAWSSTALISLRSRNPEINPIGRPVTVSEESWIVSLVSLGASCGPVLSGYFSAKFGRKITMLMFSIPMLIALVILSFATTPVEFYTARFMKGLGVGCGYTVIPMYIGEIAETNIRGFLGCMLGVFAALGYLYVICIGPFITFKVLNFVLMIPVVTFLILFGLFVPESPYHYLSKGQYSLAEESLRKLRCKHNNINNQELEEMKETLQRSVEKKASLMDSLRSKCFRKGIIITSTLLAFQQFVGITFIQSYMEPIFISTGSKISSSNSAIIVGVIQVLGTILSASLVDKLGRKMLLTLSSILCAIPLFFLGLYFYLQNTHDMTSLWWVPVVSLGVYIISYCSGICTLPWALVGELFSSEIKSLASTISATVNLALAFVVTLICPTLKEMIGFEGLFWVFSASACVCCLFVLLYVPETKGKSFQDILKILGDD